MRKRIVPISVFAISLFMLTACGGGNTNKKAEGEAIVMGDPTTIVTETDSAHLRDIVADLKPADIAKDTATTVAKVDSAAKQPDGTETKPEEPVQKAAAVKGLNIDFKEVDIVIPNLAGKLAGNSDLQKTNSATFQLNSGELNNNTLQISDATITSVQMRYQTGVNIKNNLGTLELDALNSTSGWKPLKGAKNIYTISGLEDRNLATARVNASTVRNAINKEARQRRMNKKTQQQWLNSVKNVRSANQKPMDVVLRAVMFKIDGKDKAGKSFSKQVRIDL